MILSGIKTSGIDFFPTLVLFSIILLFLFGIFTLKKPHKFKKNDGRPKTLQNDRRGPPAKFLFYFLTAFTSLPFFSSSPLFFPFYFSFHAITKCRAIPWYHVMDFPFIPRYHIMQFPNTWEEHSTISQNNPTFHDIME